MMQEDSPVYVQVFIHPQSGKPMHFLANRIPFTEFKLEPGKPIPVDKLYESYARLKEGLISEFNINPIAIPSPEYFEPRDEELEYGEDPVLRVVPPEPEEMPWDKDARRAVSRALEEAHWDFDEGTVTIYDRDDPRMSKTVASLEDLQRELEQIAMTAFEGTVPWEGGPVFSLDAEGMVWAELEAYEENIKQLGWNDDESEDEEE
jgi:hypothetical protein